MNKSTTSLFIADGEIVKIVDKLDALLWKVGFDFWATNASIHKLAKELFGFEQSKRNNL